MNSQQLSGLARRMVKLAKSDAELLSLTADPDFSGINGAFAILSAFEAGVCIVTDPLGLTQVYAGYDRRRRLTALGNSRRYRCLDSRRCL